MIKKFNDNDLIALNSVGISLAGIARRLNCHHTTVKARLVILGIPPADTRRAFMEDIYDALSQRQQHWLQEQLNPTNSIKDYIRALIIKEFVNKNI